MTPTPTTGAAAVLHTTTAGLQFELNIEGAGASESPGTTQTSRSCHVGRARPKSSMELLIAKYHLHPIVDHFTIALLAMGVLADVIGYVIGVLFDNRSPRIKGLGDRLRRAALYCSFPVQYPRSFPGLPGRARQSGSGIRFLRPRNKSSFPIPAPQGFFLTQYSAHI